MADYCDHDRFARVVASARAGGAPFSLALCWIHGDDRPVLELVLEHVADGGVLVHVVSSARDYPRRYVDES